MPRKPEIAVCILAGGSSRRFGGHEAFAGSGGKPLLANVIDRNRPQTEGPVLINANDAPAFSAFGLPIIPPGSNASWRKAGGHVNCDG